MTKIKDDRGSSIKVMSDGTIEIEIEEEWDATWTSQWDLTREQARTLYLNLQEHFEQFRMPANYEDTD